MYYFIDGYNVLFFYLIPEEDLQEKREQFIQLLDEKLTLINIEATIVFDNFTNYDDHRCYSFKTLKVVFTMPGQTADQYIIENCEHLSNVTVVTADKILAQKCKNKNACIQTPKAFLKWISEKSLPKTSLSKEQKQYEDTKANIERLLAIFEKKLTENGFD